jgi:hypothetical protein
MLADENHDVRHSSRRRRRAAHQAPPATPPTMSTRLAIVLLREIARDRRWAKHSSTQAAYQGWGRPARRACERTHRRSSRARSSGRTSASHARRLQSLRFGEDVAQIVGGCSDETARRPPWRQRKEVYVDDIREARPSACFVSAADKLHKARAIRRAGARGHWPHVGRSRLEARSAPDHCGPPGRCLLNDRLLVAIAHHVASWRGPRRLGRLELERAPEGSEG